MRWVVRRALPSRGSGTAYTLDPICERAELVCISPGSARSDSRLELTPPAEVHLIDRTYRGLVEMRIAAKSPDQPGVAAAPKRRPSALTDADGDAIAVLALRSEGCLVTDRSLTGAAPHGRVHAACDVRCAAYSV